MKGFRKYLRLVVAAVIMLTFFSPVFPFPIEKKVVSVALAKKKTLKKAIKKTKKKSIEKKSSVVFPVKISGDADCVQKTNQALSLLQKKSSGDFGKVIKNLGVVECGAEGSGAFVWENPARFKVGLATYQAGEMWYASTLVHESCHVEQYRNYSSSHPGGWVPSEIFSGSEAESQCLLEQYNELASLGAGQSLLDYTKKIAETNYWDIPYEKRWW
jgi:hypothetical protein